MNQLTGLLYGAFLGDGFALGSHWIYDTSLIANEFGEIASIVAPLPSTYHKTKKKGDFTHYGDQSLVVLKSVSEMDGFYLEKLKQDWLAYMSDYDGYLDKASKESLELLSVENNLGSPSDELGGFAILAPIIVKYHQDPRLKEYIEATIRLTHNNDLVIEMAIFYTNVILKILAGARPYDAIEALAPRAGKLINQSFQAAVKNINDSAVSFITKNGQSCHGKHAFPSSLFVILKNQDHFKAALTDNVMGGGDSAARGMIIGMILGAYLGYDTLPKEWLNELNHLPEINRYAALL